MTKENFIKVLAKFLTEDQVKKSIYLQMKDPGAEEWAKLRGATPLFGYPSIEESEEILKEFLK